MTSRDVAAVPLSLSSITYNWWSHIVDGIPAAAAYVLPTLGGILLILQISYYWKMLRK
jgi:hypothetical protein